MCILFLYVGSKDDSGDYSLILASNRDEYYDRPASNMVSWEEDPSVYGGTVCVYIDILLLYSFKNKVLAVTSQDEICKRGVIQAPG